MASEFSPAPIPMGIAIVDGKQFTYDAKGNLVPVSTIKPQHRLEDEVVRKIASYALDLSAQIARFKAHVFDDIGGFEALLAQEYGAKLGGAKGNMTLMTYDGIFKVQVQVADNVVFGPELQTAKALIDECLNEWAAGTRDEIRAVITRAFNTDKEGQVNRAQVYMLLRLEIEDDRWQRAMKAIRDAMRVVGSKTYVRFYMRTARDAPWEAVSIDLAKD